MKKVILKGRIFTWFPTTKNSFDKNISPKNENYYKTKSPLREKVQRRRNGLIKLLCSLDKQPKWFITLIYPQSYSDEQNLSKRISKDINRLATRLRRKYQNSWFVYAIEWSPKSKIHVHFIGKLGMVKNQLRTNISEWWASITGSNQSNLANVRFLGTPEESQSCMGYMTKKAKEKYIPKLVELMGNKYSYGSVNKNNLPVAQTKVFEMSDKQFQQLRTACIAELEMSAQLHTTFNQEYHKNRLAYSDSGFHISQNADSITGVLNRLSKGVI